MQYAQKLQELREIMASEQLDGYIVPRTDEYQGEYVPACAERLAWFTGFTGSAGLAIILPDMAVVMSDGRYTLQLEQQVDPALYDVANSSKTKPVAWLEEYAGKERVIGYDPKLFTPGQIKEYEDAGLVMKPVDNLVDRLWQDRPAPPNTKVFLYPEKYSGISAADKIKKIQQELSEKNTDSVVLTLSDSIAWLLNIRGNDIPHIPVSLSYAIVPAKGKVKWFVDEGKVPDDVRGALSDIADIKGLEEFSGALMAAGEEWETVLVDPKRSSIWVKNVLKEGRAEVVEGDDPCVALKAIKNEAEQQYMKEAHVRDGVAMVRFLKWFEEAAAAKEPMSELSVEEKLESFRALADEFRETSFNTIAGYGANGAIVHYRADEESNQEIKPDNLLLLDSGAQYEDGTTDITRTLVVGTPTQKMREHFTLVLKGHIALASARFPEGTQAKELDEITRKTVER